MSKAAPTFVSEQSHTTMIETCPAFIGGACKIGIQGRVKPRDDMSLYSAPNFSKGKFIITIYSFNNIERYCKSCIVKKGWGVMSVKQSKNQVCFNWNNVNYPSTSCFYVIQEDEKSYQLIDPVDAETCMYSVQ